MRIPAAGSPESKSSQNNETGVRTPVWHLPRSSELHRCLSVWPLRQFRNHLRGSEVTPALSLKCQSVVLKCAAHNNMFFIAVCTLSLRQRMQLKTCVLLSLEWSLHASSTRPHANWKSHLLTSLAFSGKINGSMNQWEGMNRLCLRGNGLCRHTHAYTPNLCYWHVSNSVSHGSDGSTAWREKRLYVRENMLLDSTEARS